MKNILFVKNIIPPYRISLFNDLYKHSQNSKLNFEVFVMSNSEDGRYWEFDPNTINFKFTNDDKDGYYKYLFRKYHFHFNPKLLKFILKNNFDQIVLGSSWNDFNVVLIVLLKKLGFIKSKIAFWSEANYLTLGAVNDNKIKFLMRKFIYNTCDSFFLIPGKMASITLFDKWKINPGKTIVLPNLVNNTIYKIDDNILTQRKKNEAIVFLIVARLEENLKGILNFISNIPLDKNIKINIAGDGEDRIIYEKFIKDNNLDNKVRLLGNLNESELLKRYNEANVFVLPSFSDPSPLSIVEASYMKLPLLISDRCGNHYETVIDGNNGFVFNPDNKDEMREKFNQLLNMGVEKLEEMGLNSYKLVNENFNSEQVIKRFVSELDSNY